MADDIVIPASVASTTMVVRVALVLAGIALASAAYRKFVKGESIFAEGAM
jgi:hypothetical protein